LAIHRVPPRPTLFPYTTLFRSDGIAERQRPAAQHLAAQRQRVMDDPLRLFGESGNPSFIDLLRCHSPHMLSRLEAEPGAEPLRIDRKSTRLNSSHVSISYAVFC